MNLITKHWERILLLCLTALFFGRTILGFNSMKNLDSRISVMAESMKFLLNFAPPIPSTAELDFSNKTGTERIQSTFTDVLVSSEGSEKKGEGYIVHLKTVNPSSVILSSSNIIYSWSHKGQSQAATVTNPNENLLAGSHVKDSAYLSPVEGDELKTINVKVDYELMRSK